MRESVDSKIKIGKRNIGRGYPTFIVAEISGNHHQNFNEAVKLIKAAAEAGADAVKLQTYTPDTMTIDSRKKWFMVEGVNNPKSWKGKSLYELYQRAYTPWEWQPKLKKIAEKLGLVFFSTPFDKSAVDFLQKIKVPCYKVASYEATDIPLLKKVASTGKPVLLSVGFADEGEIRLAIKTLRRGGTKQIAVLHCVTAYSNEPDFGSINLETINVIASRFGVVGGFSDNNAGVHVPLFAVAMGASIIEKHFTLDRRRGGADAQFSIEPKELKQLIQSIRNFEKSKGTVCFGPADEKERYNKRFRRSIFSVEDIKKGDVFTAENIRVIRPEFGLKPSLWEEVLKRRAKVNIKRGTPINLKMVSK